MDNNQNNVNQNTSGTQQQQYQQPPQYQQPMYQQQPPQYQQPMYQQPQQYQQPFHPIAVNPCPRCGSEMKVKYRGWQIAISIIFFPIGLLSLLAGKRKKCPNCGYEID